MKGPHQLEGYISSVDMRAPAVIFRHLKRHPCVEDFKKKIVKTERRHSEMVSAKTQAEKNIKK